MRAELTEPMKLVLPSLDVDDGAPVQTYHKNTIAALMARGLVELSHDRERVFLAAHKHRFKTTMHMDGCHWFSTAAVCPCGTSYTFRGERSVALDPYSTIWMEPEFQDNGCERCKRLLNGGHPQSDVVIVRPKALKKAALT